MKTTIPLFLLLMLAMTGISQTVLPLYPDSIPNSKPGPDEETRVTDSLGKLRVSKISHPTLTAYLPAPGKATGAAIIICPGGGYSLLSFSHEGTTEAEIFASWGIAAFVLKYRLPSDVTMVNKEFGPVQDAQRAIQLVRDSAKAWHIDKNKVGIMGFSAGGHLASTAGTHFDHAYINVPKKTNLRPDCMILLYPVISLTDSLAHMGSRNNLIGTKPTAEKIAEYSNELQVTNKTPPTFIVHAKDDRTVKVQNSILFAEKLQQHHVPVEIYLYEKGGHGFGMFNKTSDVKWMDMLQQWLAKKGWSKQ